MKEKGTSTCKGGNSCVNILNMDFFNGSIVKLCFQFSKTKVKIGEVRKE